MSKAPTRKKTEKVTPSPSVITLANLDQPDAVTPMNFRVSAQFHREFKLYAVQNGVSMVDLLQEAFAVLRKQRGG